MACSCDEVKKRIVREHRNRTMPLDDKGRLCKVGHVVVELDVERKPKPNRIGVVTHIGGFPQKLKDGTFYMIGARNVITVRFEIGSAGCQRQASAAFGYRIIGKRPTVWDHLRKLAL